MNYQINFHFELNELFANSVWRRKRDRGVNVELQNRSIAIGCEPLDKCRPTTCWIPWNFTFHYVLHMTTSNDTLN